MSKVVVISGHPNLSESYTNTVILDKLQRGLKDVEIRKLDQLYPDYKINVEAEQQALIEAEVIVLQFPFYWYSIPALLKKWLDDVFSYNFAYGAKGDKLKGKSLILSFTVGGPEDSYQPLGYNHFTIEQFMYPLQQTVYLAGMDYIDPIYTHKMVFIPGVYNKQEEVEARAAEHAERLLSRIDEIANDKEKQIGRFIREWFEAFDTLPDNDELFTQYLSENIRLVMPEGTFVGHSGFSDWYRGAREAFKPDCQHNVEQFAVTAKQSDEFVVELRIRLLAETYDTSVFKGESLNLLVNETWQLSCSDDGKISISDYLVEPVNNA